MQHIIGDVSITQVIEQRGASFAPQFLFPDWDPAVLKRYHKLLVPDCFDECKGQFISSIHSWIVRTGRHTILIDTCAGNHKDRPGLPRFHRLELPFLERMAEAGVPPEAVDYVMCTHLHVDHCGWNTRLVDGRWVPTFPNARYVFSRTEYEHWRSATGQRGVNAGVYQDSVLPVMESGQAVLIDGEGEAGGNLTFYPTPGHTAGHVAIRLQSRDRHAVFSGDIMHQPLQIFRPEWNSAFCEDGDPARRSRWWLLEHAAETGATVFTAHFAGSSAGRVTRIGNRFDWCFN